MPPPSAVPSTPAQRVSQLDASRLDAELQTLFLTDAQSALRHLPAGVLQRHIPELKALLRLIFHLNTISIDVPSPGNALQNLHYTTSIPPTPHLTKYQRLLHLILSILLPYLWAHLRRRATHPDHARARRVLNGLETVVRVMELVNLYVFLRNGSYRSLADRIAGTRLRYATRETRAAPIFEFVHSQLVWQGVAEGALLLAPVLALPRAFARSKVGRRLLGGFGERGAGGSGCGVCRASEVVMPHRVLPCACLFCYVCVAGRIVEGGECFKCGGAVVRIERVRFG